MLTIRGHLEGAMVVERQLKALEDRVSDMTPVWPAVLTVFREIQKAAFATEGGSTGTPWPELSPRTQREREAQGFSGAHPILHRTGTLERSLTMDGGASFVVQMPKYFAVAVDLDYFVFHQSTKPRAKIPRRAPINLTQDDKTALIRPIRLYVRGFDANRRN